VNERKFKVPVEKLCVFCRKMKTSYTSSESMGGMESFECSARYFDDVVSVAFLRENILRARKCKDYEPATSAHDQAQP